MLVWRIISKLSPSNLLRVIGWKLSLIHIYKGDERFVRIHKRIEEENQKREQPIISAHEYEIAENLSQMKSQIDNMLFLNINILDNEDAFKRDVLAIIGHKLIDLGIKANLTDRKYINNLITTEYFQQRNFAY